MPYIALVMRVRTAPLLLAAILLVLASGPSRGDNARDVYDVIGISMADVLRGTVLTAKVLPGIGKQLVTVTTYITGKQANNEAVTVRLDVFNRVGDKLVPAYDRDFGAESGALVGKGELQLIDLDLDGINEIIVSYDSFLDPLIEQRLAEVIVHEQDGFRTAWFGPVEYDATKAARGVPRERRDRFVRQFDFGNTIRTHGITLFLDKHMIAVAGERLPQPKVVQETFPLRTGRHLNRGKPFRRRTLTKAPGSRQTRTPPMSCRPRGKSPPAQALRSDSDFVMRPWGSSTGPSSDHHVAGEMETPQKKGLGIARPLGPSSRLVRKYSGPAMPAPFSRLFRLFRIPAVPRFRAMRRGINEPAKPAEPCRGGFCRFCR